jgi:signal transduction histidine kinase
VRRKGEDEVGKAEKSSSKWSLQARILILAIIISASVLTTTNWLSRLSSMKAVERAIGAQTSNAARRLAIELQGSSVNNIPPRFQRHVREVHDLEPNVTRVDVYADFGGELKLVESSSTTGDRELEGQEIAAFRQSEPATFIADADPPRQLLSIHPLRFRDGRPGFLTIVSTLQAVDDILAAHSRIRLYSLLATMALLVGAITLLFRTTVYRSVLHLVDVMSQFKRGDAAARAKENLVGEFSELARNFNAMLEEIQRSKENLQHQIEEATAELANQNQELYTLNLQLYETQRLLGQAERLALVGQLAATLAHEIGSPLSAVSTHLQMLSEEPHLDSRVSRRLRLANEQIDRVSGIVENLLASARKTPRRLPVDIETTVSKVTHLLGPTMEARHIRFRLQGDGGPFWTEGDPDQLQQLFLNLFNNSLDAIRESGTLSVKIRRRPPNESLPQPHLQVEVSDSGVGISPDQIQHIFGSFFTTKEFGKGSGLGLAVCDEIVTRHGGRISVVSQPGTRTTFTILLPEMPGKGSESLAALAKEALGSG